MPLSVASINRASYQVLLLLAAAAVSTTGGDGNTAPGNATATATTGGDDTEMYICYLCTGRNPILIRRCPIYWDYCHLNCFDDAPSTAAAADDVAAVPVASPAAPARRVGGVPRETLEDEECYVMKLYENGSYVIVTTLGCSQTASCLLSCGGGDLAADGEEALAAAHPAGAVGVSPPVRATAPRGMPPPRVADFQRCGSQAMTATPATRAITGGV
ncbi:uncharacterized protein LOC127766984 [Oryza glaberrima]|uniref:uncharacterized protein LOC127766984 n=1 Tax=Oryza glaberrima TaxID=4538 RepID=UPI00224BEEBE|nr:uncharacterized protein LOC127766984 [Oryza glaberrima]